MSKTIAELKAEAEAANRAYQDAMDNGEAKLNEIARQQDQGIRPEYHGGGTVRDEHGNLIQLDKYGNPIRGKGQKIAAATARPIYEPPLISSFNTPGSPPPDLDAKGTGTWQETIDLWLDLVDLLNRVDNDPLTHEEREICLQQLVPSLLDRIAGIVPRIDCAFPDGPMGKGSWIALREKNGLAFNPSKSLERSIGTMRSRTAPKFLNFALEGAKWLFRRSPHSGIPQIKIRATDVVPPAEDPAPERSSDTDPGHFSNAVKKKSGRPKRIPETVE